jgi:hypothetical protein
VVSVTDPFCRILGFLDRCYRDSCTFSLSLDNVFTWKGITEVRYEEWNWIAQGQDMVQWRSFVGTIVNLAEIYELNIIRFSRGFSYQVGYFRIWLIGTSVSKKKSVYVPGKVIHVLN